MQFPTNLQRLQRTTLRRLGFLFTAFLFLVAQQAVLGQCSSGPAATTPITSTDETASIQNSRQLIDGAGTLVDTNTVGQIKINVSNPAPLTITTFSAGGSFTPTANSFTNATNATDADLPATSSVPVGTVIQLSVGGSLTSMNVVPSSGEHIVSGTSSLTSLTLNNNEFLELVNMGSGNWLVTELQAVLGTVPILKGGTGATSASAARTNLGAAASGANSDITSLSGLTTALTVAQGGSGSTTASGARSNFGAAASGANSDITSLSGLTTALSAGEGGTGAATVPAKGSILAGNSGGTAYANVTVGTNGQVLQADSTSTNGVKWATLSSGTVSSFSSGNLSPLFTTSVSNPTSTPALSFSLSSAGAYSVFGNATNAGASPSFSSLVTQQLPQRSVVMGGNGGSTGVRPLPSSGSSVTLTGEYWHIGDYNTNVLTGTVTCNRCRLHVVGNLTISNAVAVNTELKGGSGFPASSTMAGSAPGQRGQGLGAGD